MELSINIAYVAKMRGKDTRRDIGECAKLIKEAGFNYVDFGVARLVKEENWEKVFDWAREAIEKEGIKINQTHAPYVFSGVDQDEYREDMRRSFVASHILGAENIVIHADKYVPDENGFNPEIALNEICEFYSPFVDYAKKVNLKVAVENLFEGRAVEGPTDFANRTRYTSYVEEQIAVIEKFNDPIVTGCWDFGHGQVSYRQDYIQALKKVGKYITSTHVHDNFWGKDLHNMPFHGDIKWEEVMEYLKEINYPGKFTMEAVYGSFPDALLPHYLKMWYETGKYLVNL